MILHLLEKMPSSVDEVLLAANYKVDQLRDFVRTHDLGRTVTIVEEPKALGTGGAIKNLEGRLAGTFLAFNGGIGCSLAVGDLVAAPPPPWRGAPNPPR